MKREDHPHPEKENSGQKVRKVDILQSSSGSSGSTRWVNLHRTEIMFEGDRCLLLSMRDISSNFALNQKKEQVELLKKFSKTISKDLVDPLNLIIASANWLIWQHKEKQKASDQADSYSQNQEVLENLYNILVASKMSLFKCKDLLEINASSATLQQSLTRFRLKRSTEEIKNIIELQSRGKKIIIRVTYENQALKDAKFLGDATNYQQVFLNVLQNAVVYSPPESVVEVKFSISPMAEIKHDDYEDGCTILLSVIV